MFVRNAQKDIDNMNVGLVQSNFIMGPARQLAAVCDMRMLLSSVPSHSFFSVSIRNVFFVIVYCKNCADWMSLEKLTRSDPALSREYVVYHRFACIDLKFSQVEQHIFWNR